MTNQLDLRPINRPRGGDQQDMMRMMSAFDRQNLKLKGIKSPDLSHKERIYVPNLRLIIFR